MTERQSQKKVTVAMSVYGYENVIKDTIKSILNQSFVDFEFVIVDDGCDYELEKIVNGYKDDRIIYIKNEYNIGLTKSLIKIKGFLKGKYIARIDAGNLASKDRLEKQVHFLENNPDYYLIGSSVLLFDENNEEICTLIANDDPIAIKEMLPKYNMISHSSIIFRNDGAFFYREKFKYAQDYDFYLNLLSMGKNIGNLKDVLTKELFTKKSITYLKQKEQKYYEELARKFYFERLKNGIDSYDTLNEANSSDDIENKLAKNSKKSYKFYKDEDQLFFEKQKAYYLLRSFRFNNARKVIKESFKIKFSLKMLLYYLISYFPFLIKYLNKKDKVEFR